MGVHDRMIQMLRTIANKRRAVLTDEEANAAYKRINPRSVPCGIVGIGIVIPCKCGHNVGITASPERQSKNELMETNEGEDVSIVDASPKTADPDEKCDVAANLGGVDKRCDNCGRLYLLAWECIAVKIVPTSTIPWDDPESPDHPTSGPFMLPNDGSGTVH